MWDAVVWDLLQCFVFPPYPYTGPDCMHAGCHRDYGLSRRFSELACTLATSVPCAVCQVVEPLDPRIHFALVCGAKSCPPIRVYTPASLEAGLEAAAQAFCSGARTCHRRHPPSLRHADSIADAQYLASS